MSRLERLTEALRTIGRWWAKSELPAEFPMRVVESAFIAARRYADLLANGQEVEWCEVHEDAWTGEDDGSEECHKYQRGRLGMSPCRIVSRLLVPPIEASLYPKEAENE